MFKIIILFIIVIIGIVSCNSNDINKCSNNFEKIYGSEEKKFPTHIKNDKKVLLVKDIGVEEGDIGGEYSFFESGNIKLYRFFTSRESYSYAEYFSKEGILDSTEGNPILISNVDEINKDSIKYNFYISNLGKEIISFSIKINNSGWITLGGDKDSVFSNVMRYEFPLNTLKTKSVKILEKLLYNSCNGGTKEAIDSVFIRRSG